MESVDSPQPSRNRCYTRSSDEHKGGISTPSSKSSSITSRRSSRGHGHDHGHAGRNDLKGQHGRSHGPRRSISRTSSNGSSSNGTTDGPPPYHQHMIDGTETPPLLSSPSVVSSAALSGGFSPLRRELSRTTLHDDGGTASPGNGGREALARRLSLLAQRLTYGEDVDELALGSQVDQLEKALGGSPVDSISYPAKQPQSPPMSDEMLRGPSRSELGSLFGSPVSSLFQSRFSDLSASLCREREAEEAAREQREQEEALNQGMTPEQASKIVAETNRLNDELSTLVDNLRARQEEAEHIQALLIERAERAAQRIMFLQSRISHLEQELHENDDELQHLRISLKAVEIQMPSHPDTELQRCITSFKDDYQALRRKRTYRSSVTSSSGTSYFDRNQTITVTSPQRW